MRRTWIFALALLALMSVPILSLSQGGQMEASRGVAGGGVSVPGWTGKIDAKEETAGMTLNSAKLAKEGDALHVTTGPAVTYWNPANKASGDYTVKATFREPKYMSINSHPHPYGIVIGGNDLGTDQQSYLYCAAYGNGTFIVRGFGPAPFQMNGRAPAADPARPTVPASNARRLTCGAIPAAYPGRSRAGSLMTGGDFTITPQELGSLGDEACTRVPKHRIMASGRPWAFLRARM